ncbi:MAG: glycoside-pentoside-hexuronide (GPH):cation symporter [Desulfobacterales bacterium]|jgi:GPH family glycoside/pentoside/hexuronide:cation symporter
MKNQHLSFSTKISYALPSFFMAVIGIPVYVYIPKFYTDVIGVNIAFLGYILFSVRIFDAVTDPMIGYLSDRTRTRAGRRRPYIAIGSVFVALAMIMLFNPPAVSATLETVWFGVCIYALFLFWTIVVVPYESLGPEITFNYNERTSLFGWRDGFLIAGTLAAASSPAIVQWLFGLTGDAEGERSKFFWISMIYAPLLIASCLWCVMAIKELPHGQDKRPSDIRVGLRQTAHNKPFIILLIAYTVSAIGNNLPATLILYYVEYVLQSKMADAFLLLYFATGIFFLPVWIRMSHRTGKKIAWIASMAINTGAFIGVFFLGPGDTLIYGILVFLSGIGFGATLAIPSAIQADVIDYDELLTGERREGQYIGLWSIAKKFAAAVGIGVGLSVLGMAGYAPNTEQPAAVQLTLRILYALIPSICNMIAIAIAFAYPISSRSHADIRSAIARRKQGLPAVNPLNPAQTLV